MEKRPAKPFRFGDANRFRIPHREFVNVPRPGMVTGPQARRFTVFSEIPRRTPVRFKMGAISNEPEAAGLDSLLAGAAVATRSNLQAPRKAKSIRRKVAAALAIPLVAFTVNRVANHAVSKTPIELMSRPVASVVAQVEIKKPLVSPEFRKGAMNIKVKVSDREKALLAKMLAGEILLSDPPKEAAKDVVKTALARKIRPRWSDMTIEQILKEPMAYQALSSKAVASTIAKNPGVLEEARKIVDEAIDEGVDSKAPTHFYTMREYKEGKTGDILYKKRGVPIRNREKPDWAKGGTRTDVHKWTDYNKKNPIRLEMYRL